MANAIGSLVVRLGLDAVEFITGLERSDKEAKKFAANMERDAKKIGAALGIHISAGVTALFLMTKSAIDTADKLNDLSKSTGISAEILGGLGFAAKQSGTDIEGVASSVGKLNIKIGAAIAGNEDAAQAFAKVGISLKDLRDSSPDQILQKLADRFATYDDHANTAALANVYFGKSYQSILPLLREGGDSLRQNIAYFAKYGGVNDDVVKRSDQFNDTLTKLGLLSGAFARNLAAALLPSLQGVADEFVKAKEKGDGFKSGAEGLAEVLKSLAVGVLYTVTAFQQVGTVIGATAAQMGALASLDFAAFRAIQADASADLDKMAARRDALISAIRNPAATVGAGIVSGPGRVRAPSVPDSGAAGKADAAAKALLDAQLRTIDNAIKEERDLYKDRQHFLQEYYADDLISIAKYYSTRQQFADDQVKREVAANDERIALLRAAKPKDEAERIKNEREIADVIANTRKVEREYFNESIDNRIAATRSVKQFNESLQQVQITLATMRGDTVGAATLGVAAQYADMRRHLLAQGQSTAGIDEIAKRTIDQARLTKATEQYSIEIDKLGIAQSRVDLLAQTGTLTEIDLLNRRADLAKQYIPILTAQADAQMKIALAMDAGPARERALLDVERMRLGIDQLAASTEALGRKFSEIFERGFSDAFTDFLDGTKSAKEAFNSFTKSVLHDINSIVSKQLANALFGGGSAGGGIIGSFFASLLGGGAAASATSASWTAMSAATIPSYASGTNSHPGGWAKVHRDEIINLPRGAQVIPMDRLKGGGDTYVTNTTIMPGTTKQSQDQAVGSLMRAQMRARRNA